VIDLQGDLFHGSIFSRQTRVNQSNTIGVRTSVFASQLDSLYVPQGIGNQSFNYFQSEACANSP
jgi:hypothetical protein